MTRKNRDFQGSGKEALRSLTSDPCKQPEEDHVLVIQGWQQDLCFGHERVDLIMFLKRLRCVTGLGARTHDCGRRVNLEDNRTEAKPKWSRCWANRIPQPGSCRSTYDETCVCLGTRIEKPSLRTICRQSYLAVLWPSCKLQSASLIA